jgi:hypothetical protein
MGNIKYKDEMDLIYMLIDLTIRGGLRCFGRVSSSFSTSRTRRATIVTNLVMNEERTGDI